MQKYESDSSVYSFGLQKVKTAMWLLDVRIQSY